MKSVARLAFLAAAGLCASSAVAQADTFTLTSCHISTGCPPAGTSFGTVTLTQVGANVTFDVTLINGNKFIETGSGGNELFLFNAPAGSTITSITATLNGATVTIPTGLSGLTNISPAVHADGTGDWTASVECTQPATGNGCNPGNILTINDLHFTVTNATIAQLTTPTAASTPNIFVADILCGSAQTQCNGLTGPVDVTGTPLPEPGSLLFFGPLMALAWMVGVRRWKRQ